MNYYETDPEFMERFEHFAFDEVVNEESRQLEPKTRYLVVLAALIGCQGEAAYREILPKALEAGLSPVAVKETVYQAVDYLGMGRMWQFLRAANEIFAENEIVIQLIIIFFYHLPHLSVCIAPFCPTTSSPLLCGPQLCGSRTVTAKNRPAGPA